MRFLKYAAVLPLAFSFIGSVQAQPKDSVFYEAPFSNVEVKAASKIYVNYEVGGNQTLFCHALANDAITSVEWVYKDTTRKVPLPVTLKDSANVEGYYADPDGQLSITNEFGSGPDDGSIFVSCEYRRVK